MPIPATFDPTLPLKQSAHLYGVAPSTIFKWRQKVGYVPPRDDLWGDDDIHRLKTLYSGNSLNDVAAMLGRTVSAVKSKAIALGLRRATGNFAPDRAPQIRGRCQGQADMAAQFLQRFAPVFRADADGSANPKGESWRYGSSILTEAELFARAERKGFDPDGWKRLAA